MEELGLDETLAQAIIDRCATEAKLVEAEQEAKKAAEAAARAAGLAPVFGGALAAAKAAQAEDAGATAGTGDGDGAVVGSTSSDGGDGSVDADDAAAEDAVLADEPDGRLPGALEAAAGVSPELSTHAMVEVADADELSPEERAIRGVEVAPGDDNKIEEEPAATQVAEAKEQG
jgi:hypothetical protein